MSTQLTLGSLFDGIGGFPLAGKMAGIKPVWASEIEPFPILVTSQRFSDMAHLGDIHQLSGDSVEPVDIVTFGSPCQNLSIAGNRKGLGGEQSSLFFEAIRVIKEMRENSNGLQPNWLVWENVPGALSSCKGRDFREVLEALIRIKAPQADVPMPSNDKWLTAGEIVGDDYSLAWRIIDASKGWGVAQRRRRVFVVVDLAGQSAGKVLFESEGMSGYTPPSNQAWERAADGTQSCPSKASGHCGVIGFEPGAAQRLGGHAWNDSIGTLRAHMGDNQAAVAIEFNPNDSRIKIKEDGICQTLCSRMGTGGNNVPLTMKVRCGCEGGGKGALVQENKSATLACNNDQTLFVPKSYGISSDQSNGMLSSNPQSGIYEAETSRTLDCAGGNPSCNQGGMLIVDKTDKEAYFMSVGCFGRARHEEAATLAARDYKDPPLIGSPEEIPPFDYYVRRLTPLECARLQGYPDGWCADLAITNPTAELIECWRDIFLTWQKALGKTPKPRSDKQIMKWLASPKTDAAEYKAYGNSVAVPCVHFVLAGIVWAINCDR